jgi:intein/homing endonuclease
MNRSVLEQRIQKALASQDPDKLRDFLRSRASLKEAKEKLGPQTKDELNDWIELKTGFRLAEVAVCPGHTSQLDMAWEVYSFAVTRVLWVMSRGGGKCLPGSALVYDAKSGREVPIEDLCDGQPLRVAAMDEHGKIVAADAYGEPNIVKPCVTLKMRGGRSITLSDDHPVLAAGGWRHAGDVQAGERLAMPHSLPQPDWIVPYGDAELDLLALLLAEGGYTGQSVMFTSADDSLLQIARVAVETFGCRLEHSQKYDYRVSYHRGVKNPVRDMLDRAGLGNTLAKHKRVPKLLFKASDEQVERFLQLFWMCDGYVNHNSPEITLASEGLVRDIRLLLLRLGIQSSMREKVARCDSNTYRSWRLTVLSTSFKTFHRRLRLWGHKGQKMDELVARNGNPNRGRPVLPQEFLDRLEDGLSQISRDERRERGRELCERWGVNPRSLATHLIVQPGRATTSASRLAAVVDAVPEVDLASSAYLWSDDLWWDDVVGVEDAGMLMTYDLCVPDHGNFVADGLVVHNTSVVGWIDECQAEHFPGWSSFTIGANKTQGDRKYEYMLPMIVEGGVIGGKELPHVIRSTATVTQYKNGSKNEIALGGSKEQANGPRTPRLHRDETELMDPETYKQAGNIPAGRKLRDGRYAPAQILDTSTMKYAGGKIDTQIEEYREATEKGIRPRMEVRICCLYEVARENPTCRSVPDEQRRARLVELGRDPDEICDCDTWFSDVWPSEEGTDEADAEVEDEPRSLESVCQGRFFRSRGHKEFDDVQTLFLENDRETWEAEQECSQAAREGSYIKSYNKTRHGIKGYEPDPENGPIYNGVDFGGTDEHTVLWFQELERPVRVLGFVSGEPRTLPVGATVLFSEIYRGGIGNVALGNMVKDREASWVMKYPGWRVDERYPDYAAASARMDWNEQCGLHTSSRIKKDFLEEVKLVRSLIGNRGRFYIDIPACPIFDKAVRAWRQVNGREVHDWSTHPMAALRYYEHNRHVMRRKDARKRRAQGNMPVAAGDGDERVRQREAEIAAMRQRARPFRQAATVQVIGEPDNDTGLEVVGDVVGVEDSPIRRAGFTIGGESDWRSGFGGHQR